MLLIVGLILWAKLAGLFVVSFCKGFHIELISVFGNAEFRLIAMHNLYSIFSCISTLKSCKPKFYSSLIDKANFCIVCHMLD